MNDVRDDTRNLAVDGRLSFNDHVINRLNKAVNITYNQLNTALKFIESPSVCLLMPSSLLADESIQRHSI